MMHVSEVFVLNHLEINGQFLLLTLHLSNSKVFVKPVHSCTMD